MSNGKWQSHIEAITELCQVNSGNCKKKNLIHSNKVCLMLEYWNQLKDMLHIY
jgi:hypothetical protein